MINCIFCKIANGKENFIYEDDNFFSIFDINPEVEGHVLVISKKHFETIFDLPVTLGSELLDCIKKTSFELTKKFQAEGFNVVSNVEQVAGQVIPHFHVHILPRKKNDGRFLSLKKN